MKVFIKSDVRAVYISRTSHGVVSTTDWNWADLLGLVEGLVLKVDTKFLFKDQLNTHPLPSEKVEELVASLSERKTEECRTRCRSGLSLGIRVMDWMWHGIDDDIRSTRKICRWCNHHSGIKAKACVNCEKSDHFEPLIAEPIHG